MKNGRREAFPSILFAGLLGHIFVSVPLLLYVLSTIDGRIVFYFLLFSFQLYVCTLVCLSLFIRDEFVPRLAIRFLRLFSIFCWGGLCFMVYAMIGSMVYARFQRDTPPARVSPPVTLAATDSACSFCRRDEGVVQGETRETSRFAAKLKIQALYPIPAKERGMQLYLMQHGQTVPETENPERPLSREGVAQIKNSAAAMKKLGIVPDLLICSPKKRSRQSAALVAEGVNFPYSDIVESDAVLPAAPAGDTLLLLHQYRENNSILLAGHLPSLANIASLLLGDAAQVRLRFENGGLCRIDTADLAAGKAELVFHLPAALMQRLG